MCGTNHAVAMNSCMNALHAAVTCAGAGAGDEVIFDAEFVFGAVAVLYGNAIPVFVDIDPVTHNMDPDKLETAIRCSTSTPFVWTFNPRQPRGKHRLPFITYPFQDTTLLDIIARSGTVPGIFFGPDIMRTGLMVGRQVGPEKARRNPP